MIVSSNLDQEEMIDAHYYAKRMYDPTVHEDFDSIEEFERAVITDYSRKYQDLA